MLTITPPLATTRDEVWLFVSSAHDAVDVARLAHFPGSDRFIALPIAVFNTRAALPTYAATGELVAGFRWATTDDIEAHAHLFTP